MLLPLCRVTSHNSILGGGKKKKKGRDRARFSTEEAKEKSAAAGRFHAASAQSTHLSMN